MGNWRENGWRRCPMYRLTPRMVQSLRHDLHRYHDLFSGGRCQGWELEELIVRAIKSDAQANHHPLCQCQIWAVACVSARLCVGGAAGRDRCRRLEDAWQAIRANEQIWRYLFPAPLYELADMVVYPSGKGGTGKAFPIRLGLAARRKFWEPSPNRLYSIIRKTAGFSTQ